MLVALADTAEEKEHFEGMARLLSQQTREALPPQERYQKALEAMAEARAKKERAQKHAKEAAELLDKA
eukprot:4826838-Lingulodinium_polyedra.AAC.1